VIIIYQDGLHLFIYGWGKLDRGNSEFILDTLADTFCGAFDAENAGFAG
jgi:hypothetical protein